MDYVIIVMLGQMEKFVQANLKAENRIHIASYIPTMRRLYWQDRNLNINRKDDTNEKENHKSNSKSKIQNSI